MTRHRAVAVVFAIAALAAGGVWIASSLPPSWYAPPAADDAAATEVGEGFEQRLASAVSRVRDDDEPWAVRISEEQINAWLATRLPAWLRHLGSDPSRRPPQVRLVEGACILAAPLGERLVSATMSPVVQDDGIRLEIGNAAVGALPLPIVGSERLAALAARVLGSADDDMARAALTLLEGRPLKPVQELGDGRTIELLAIEVHDREVLLQFRTARVPRPSRP